jgi:hypothetical protein
MAAEAEAAREARAKVIAAEGEMKASRALKEASDVIAESPAALQVAYSTPGYLNHNHGVEICHRHMHKCCSKLQICYN